MPNEEVDGDVEVTLPIQTALSVGPRAIAAYRRMSYTMWYALAEFIDNSTQSKLNYEDEIGPVLDAAGVPLTVDILHDRPKRVLTIEDNSIGMDLSTLVAALRVAEPTDDSKGRSRYGMGMKTAACWIGNRWQVVTTKFGSEEEWTATVDVNKIAYEDGQVPLTSRKVDRDDHYTKIIISDLNRNIQGRTEDTIRAYLGSMYRFDLKANRLLMLYNGVEIQAPEDEDLDTDHEGKPMRLELPPKDIGGKPVTGWVGVMRKGGRKFGGFSLFQNERQIQGFPNAWKPSSIFGGVDAEGANNLISQRLTGVLNLDSFTVSHTKDAILFSGDEEEQLEEWLAEQTADYRNYASTRRGKKEGFSRAKVRDLIDQMKGEFTTPEMADAVNHSILPPLETIENSNEKLFKGLNAEDEVARIDVATDLRVVVWLVENSEFEPHAILEAGAEPGTIHVIINSLHPYYDSLESPDSIEECIKQYVYDAIAEFRVSKIQGHVNPTSSRRFKDALLRVNHLHQENLAKAIQNGKFETNVNT
jgi:hypothetical protein